MRGMTIVMLALVACSGRNGAEEAPPDGIGATQSTADAGTVAAAPVVEDAGSISVEPAADAGTIAAVPVTPPSAPVPADAGSPSSAPVTCDNVSPPPGHVDDSPPDAGVTYSPGPAPGLARQNGQWVPTGAAGCDGLLPAAVAPQLSWTSSGDSGGFCFLGEPFLDGDGHLAYDGTFFPSDGSASQRSNGGIIGARPSGFFTSRVSRTTQWDFTVAADGTVQDFVRSDSDPNCTDFIYSAYSVTQNPRGGYVESRIQNSFADDGNFHHAFEVRFTDANLVPRSQWISGMDWDYSYNTSANVYVDQTGKALVMLYFDPPMSMPCPGAMTGAFWAADDGTVTAFNPVTPTVQTAVCDGPQFATPGSAVALAEGGFAFYQPPSASTDGFNVPSQVGWYVSYASGSGVAFPAPAWLGDYDGSLTLLADGSAYLATRLDSVSCTRTAELVGPAGELCATLPLEASGGCDASDEISPDGTLVLHARDSCAVRWWPKLGRSH